MLAVYDLTTMLLIILILLTLGWGLDTLLTEGTVR